MFYLLRDSEHRPICRSPLDINHALWMFTKKEQVTLTQREIDRHILYFDGDDMQARLDNAELERRAMYDLIVPESFEKYMNCTLVDTKTDNNIILETITIPF